MIDFRKQMDEVLAKKQEDRKTRERSGKFNPSLMGRCFRIQVFNRLNVTPSNPIDARTLRVFAVGNMLEEYIVSLLGLEKEILQVLVEEEDVKGYADVVDENVYDIKSQHSRAFHYMESEGYDIKVSKKHNILQVCYYARELGKERGILVFFSKDDLCIYQHPFFVSEFSKALDLELFTLRKAWKEKVLPKAEPRCFFDKNGKTKACSMYCEYRDLCKSLSQGEIPFEEIKEIK